MKVVHPFILNQKTILPGSTVTENDFIGQETVMKKLLGMGFLTDTEKVVKNQAPVTVAKIQPMGGIEIKSDADLKKAIEAGNKTEETPFIPETKEEAVPEVKEEEKPAPKQKSGKLNRN